MFGPLIPAHLFLHIQPPGVGGHRPISRCDLTAQMAFVLTSPSSELKLLRRWKTQDVLSLGLTVKRFIKVNGRLLIIKPTSLYGQFNCPRSPQASDFCSLPVVRC